MRRAALGLGVVALCVAAPASAAGSVACSHAQVVDQLTIGATPLAFSVVVEAENIEVKVNGTTVDCSGWQATVHNTTKVVGGEGSYGATIDLRGGAFAPGAGDEPGLSDEVEFDLSAEYVTIQGTAGNDLIRMGTAGVNLNPGAEGGKRGDFDADVTFTGSMEVVGSAGDDEISAAGGLGTGAPAERPLTASGDGGSDVLEGGGGADVLRAAWASVTAVEDTLRGNGGEDVLVGNAKVIDGGAGSDRYGALQGMTIDLGVAGPQATGSGVMTFTSVENLSGSAAADVFVGDGGANKLDGGPGDDTLRGAGGPDALSGGAGDDALDGGAGDDTLDGAQPYVSDDAPDTVSYAFAPAGVVVDLAQSGSQDTLGAGRDTIVRASNVVGSEFGDALTGTPDANRVVAGGGIDAVSTLAGEDSVDVHDGLRDTVDCGASADSVTGDTIDSLTDCESSTLIADTLPPQTTIDSGPSGVIAELEATFDFSSSEPGSTFVCRLDDAPAFDCASPTTLGPLAEGAHTFRVYAQDPSGNADPTAAERSFRVEIPTTGPAPGDLPREEGGRKPAIARFSIKPRRFEAGAKSRFSYALTEAARVEVRVRKRGKRRRFCTLARRASAGRNQIRFRGRLGGRKLRRGRYRATLVVFDASGKRADARSVGFRVLRHV